MDSAYLGVADSRSEVATSRFATVPVLVCSCIAIFLHLVCIESYGYFRDELYYLACSQNLAWGYVDHPPLSIALLKAWTSLFGEGLAAIRSLGILVSAITVFLFARLTYELGGKKQAQILAAICVVFSPVHQVVSHLFSMNSIDIALWALAILIFVRALAKNDWINWLSLGIVLGFGLLNKLSVLWLVLSIFLALVLTENRKALATPKPYASLGIAMLIWSPYLVWQVNHGWPTLEFMQNAVNHKLVSLSVWEFLSTQIVVTNPFAAIVWITGLVVAWRHRKWRVLAIIFTTVLAVLLISTKSRENYLSPAYAAIIPIGAIAVMSLCKKFNISSWVPISLVSALGLLLVPLGLPMLPPKVVMKIAAVSPVKPPDVEKGRASPMQGHADMFGWPELALAVKSAKDSLPTHIQKSTPVWAFNYGEASALSRFAPEVGPVISPHNNFYLWGYGDYSGESLLIVGDVSQEFLAQFESHRLLSISHHPLAVPDEQNVPIYWAQDLRITPEEFWTKSRKLE